jgi:serine protease Do
MPMAGTFAPLAAFRRPALALVAAAAIALPLAATAQGRGPDKIADVAEAVIDAVVNISTSQTVTAGGPSARTTPEGRQGPQLPPGSPFEEFFEEFFKNRRGQGENKGNTPRRVNSLGSGFVIDPAGLVVTNNHVIADADEISVVFNDGSKLKAELIGKDSKTDLALLRVKPEKPLKAVKFGNSEKLRLGEWVVAIGNPFSLGGIPAPTTTTSRPMRRSIAAIRAGRCSTSTAKSWASIPRSSRRRAARSESASRCPPRLRSR